MTQGKASEFTDLVSMLDISVMRFGDQPLFGGKRDDRWDWITYRDFYSLVLHLSQQLWSMGLRRGDALALIAGNSVEWAACAYATMRIGANFVPMYESQTMEDWQYIVNDCGAKILLVNSFQANLSTVLMTPQQTPKLKQRGLIEYLHGDKYITIPSARFSDELIDARVAPDDPACIIYTSGTTGKPKGVVLTHKNIISNVNAVTGTQSLTPEDRCLSFLPWAHSFGQTCELHTFIANGAQIAICEGVDKIIDNLAEVRPTVLCAVPRIFNRIYAGVQKQISEKPSVVQSIYKNALKAAHDRRVGRAITLSERGQLWLADKLIFSKVRQKFGGRLRYAFSGGAALSPEVAEFIDTLGIAAYEGYGLSETSPIVACNTPLNNRLGSVGQPLPGVRVVIDESAVEGVECGHGEIIVYGPNVMWGYNELPEETARVMTADGGFRTGDIGCIDRDGYLFITGRIKEQYKLQNGKYVAPAPLEENLKLSPFIANVMIYGDNQPHNVALVVPDFEALRLAGQDYQDRQKLKQLLGTEIDKYSEQFPKYARIKSLAVINEDFTTENGLLTPTMKVKRREVMKQYGDLIFGLYGQPKPAK